MGMDGIYQVMISDLKNLLDNIDTSKNKLDLNFAINSLFNLIKKYGEGLDLESNLHLLEKICSGFSNKVVDLIYRKSDIADREYIVLFRLFYILEKLTLQHSKDIQLDISTQNLTLLQSFESLSVNNFLKMPPGEKIMLLEIGALSKILQRKSIEAIEFYIFGILHLDFRESSSLELASFLLQNFDLLCVDFTHIQNSIRKAMEIEYFFSLNKTVQRSIFNWQLHTIWNLKRYFNLKEWKNLYPIWRDIFYEYLKLDNIESAMYAQFFIYHMCGNAYESLKDWEIFNVEISKKSTPLYKKYIENNLKNLDLKKISKNQNEINIAILKDRLVLNSPHKVEFSLMKNYLSIDGKYKVRFRIYLMSFIEKSQNDVDLILELQKIGVCVIDVVSQINEARYYNSHLDKAIALYKAIKTDDNDILISPNNGYGLSDFLMMSDCARKKVFYSHGNFAYDIDGIDYRLTHICGSERLIAHNNFEFFGVSVKMDKIFYNPPIDLEMIKNVKNKLKINNELIFGTIGRLVKIDSLEYLELIIKIMRKINSIYLCCGIGNEASIKNKILQIDENMLSRFKFLGYVDSGVYGHVIEFWPDSFPMQQGESRIEFSAKNGLNLVLSTESRKSRKERIQNLIENNIAIFHDYKYKKDILDILLNDSFVAFDKIDYEQKFLNLINKKDDMRALLKKQTYILERIKEHNSKIMFDLFLEETGL